MIIFALLIIQCNAESDFIYLPIHRCKYTHYKIYICFCLPFWCTVRNTFSFPSRHFYNSAFLNLIFKFKCNTYINVIQDTHNTYDHPVFFFEQLPTCQRYQMQKKPKGTDMSIHEDNLIYISVFPQPKSPSVSD